MDQFTWVYGAIGALGVLGMAATNFLFNRINNTDGKISRFEKDIDKKLSDHEQKSSERAIENERRFALKEDLGALKDHMDKRFDQLGSLIIKYVNGGRN